MPDNNNDFGVLHQHMFVVDENPYCIWDFGSEHKLKTFLENFDALYFKYVAEQQLNALDTNVDKEKQFAATLIRQIYVQSLETFFGIVGAFIQYPVNIIPWLLAYSPGDTVKIAEKLLKGKNLLTLWNYEICTFDILAKIIIPEQLNAECGYDAQKCFSLFWKRIAQEYIAPNLIAEYNSIKHGFRALPGGIHSMTISSKCVIDGGDFGSNFPRLTKVSGKKYQSCIEDISTNWSPNILAYDTAIVSFSIHNIIARYKLFKNYKDCVFHYPGDEDDFNYHFKNPGPGLLNFKMNHGLDHSTLPDISKEMILAVYDKNKAADNNSRLSP